MYRRRTPIFYQGPLNAPRTTPPRPKFVSCDRLPQPEPHRRTWSEVFDVILWYSSRVVVILLIIEIVTLLCLNFILYPHFSRFPVSSRDFTHYETLNIGHDAGQADIHKAWRRQSNLFHPDKVPGGNTEKSREQWYWIQLAYVELSDPVAKCYHDQYHGLLSQDDREQDLCQDLWIIHWIMGGECGLRSSIDSLENSEALAWVASTKQKAADWSREQVREWRDPQRRWNRLESLKKQAMAFPHIAVGFVIALTEIAVGCIIEFASRYHLRRRAVELYLQSRNHWQLRN
jgi:hypothetical protein